MMSEAGPDNSTSQALSIDDQTVLALERVYGEGDLNEIQNLFAADYVEHDPGTPGPARGPESVAQFIVSYRRAFPDLQLTLTERVTEGDTVLLRWTGCGTHAGAMRSFEPSGKRIGVKGTTITRIDRGKAVEGWSNWEFGALSRQLSLWPRSVA
jgi:predicted ester cyclase